MPIPKRTAMSRRLSAKKPPPGEIGDGFHFDGARAPAYLSEEFIEVNLSLRFDQRPVTPAMRASAIPAAIRPYSMAVAPDLSDKNFNKVRFIPPPIGLVLMSRNLGWNI